jgi:pimeloyl-ACP methyl ester carboxylesterase
VIQTWQQALPHGITLSCRACGPKGRPVLMFLHGFPEAAFVWDEQLEAFAALGYRCVAPNLRGFERSSAPDEVKAYRPRFLVQDIAALIALEGAPLHALVAHDWGGAVAWNIANQMPQLIQRLAIINSPHPGTFWRDLQHDATQQAASAYMNFLIQPQVESLLAADDFRMMFGFLTTTLGGDRTPEWLDETVKNRYRQVWGMGLSGGCNYYRASPLRPPTAEDPGAAGVTLPREALTVDVPTQVIWGMDDVALPARLIEGLDDYIADLRIARVPGATHWIVHEQPALVTRLLADFFAQ